jgi:hypothetical protein
MNKIFINQFVICRTKSAGVFAGILKQRKDGEVLLADVRRIWYWSGAASLSQLAEMGTSDPSNCKFPAATAEQLVRECIELIPCTPMAIESITKVQAWKA